MSDDKHMAGMHLPAITDIISAEIPYVSQPGEIEIGLLQMQILWLLDRNSSHGYELMKTLTALKGTRMTQGTLYPTLQRLEELGLIEGEAAGRKIIYHVTGKGRKALKDSCMAFVKIFYGVFHDYVCERCDHYLHHKEEGK